MEPPIPADAVERIAPVLRELQQQLQPLLDRLSDTSDSALQFRIPEEP
jgi:hypothetical protein